MPEPITAQIVLRSGRTVFVTLRYDRDYLKCKVLSDSRNIWDANNGEFVVNTRRADGNLYGYDSDAVHLHAAATLLARAVGLLPSTPPRVPQQNFTHYSGNITTWANMVQYVNTWTR